MTNFKASSSSIYGRKELCTSSLIILIPRKILQDIIVSCIPQNPTLILTTTLEYIQNEASRDSF